MNVSDPTTAASTTATAVGGGISAMIVAAIGLDPHQLFFAAAGAAVGAGVPKKLGRVRTIFTFVCVVILSAAFGTALAEHAWSGSESMAKAASGFFGLLFHPLLAAAVSGAPDMIKAITEAVKLRISGGRNNDNGGMQ
jgi:hypothetical protein